MALPLIAAIPQSGSVVSRWKLDEASGNRSDSVGSNTLTDNNTVLSGTGPFGDTCADFESTNSEYLSITDAAQTGLDITGDMTISAWVNFESTPGLSVGQVIAAKYDSGGNQRRQSLFLYNDAAQLKMWSNLSADGSSVSQPASNWTPSTGTWYHVVAIYDAGTGTSYYVGGASLATGLAMEASLLNSTAPFQLGAEKLSGSVSSYFDGLMQDVFIWNVALTGAEVTSLYNAYYPTSSSKLALLGVG